MDRTELIRANIFPFAHAAIEDWTTFPWHLYAHSAKSSQVLAIDVFGTIKSLGPTERDAVLATVAGRLGLAVQGPWEVHLEWQDAGNGLNELTPTQVDAVAISPNAMILFECKFTEAGGGCSQIKPDRLGRVACDGAYRPQINPQNGIEARCALAGKGIRYWDHIPTVFGVDGGADHAPCLFAFDSYQWMRNVLLARSLRMTTGKQTRVVAAFVDAPHLQTAAKVASGVLGQKPVLPIDAVVPLSYAGIIAAAAEAAPSEVWSELAIWVEAKIARTRSA